MAPEWIARVRSSGRFSEYEWPEVVSVEVTTLDALIERYGVPDFCKIDVEGYEREVIAGLSHPIRFMSFEFVPEWAEGALESVSRLQALGMESFNYSPGESMRLVWSDWTSSAQLLAYLDELPRDGSVFGDVYARL